MTTLHKTLMVVMTEPVRFHLMAEPEVDLPLAVNGGSFTDAGYGDWVGFYDWLRTSAGEIVGVRTSLSAPGVEGIREQLGRNAAIDIVGEEVRVWFSDKRSFAEMASDDQELGAHRILRSDEGVVALTFNLESLSDEELTALSSMAS